LALHEKSLHHCLISSLQSLRTSVTFALTVIVKLFNAEITEVRTDRREDVKSRQGLF